MILFNDFKAHYATVREAVRPAVDRVLDSAWYILGEELQAFEAAFGDYVGAQHAVGVASGTDAIALALRFDAPIFVHCDVYRTAAVNINQAKAGQDVAIQVEEQAMDPVDHLKSRLEKAVEEEKYEVAAKLRDELQRMKPGN